MFLLSGTYIVDEVKGLGVTELDYMVTNAPVNRLNNSNVPGPKEIALTGNFWVPAGLKFDIWDLERSFFVLQSING